MRMILPVAVAAMSASLALAGCSTPEAMTRQGLVDVLERPFGCCPCRGGARFAKSVEHSPRFHRLLRLERQERELQSGCFIFRIDRKRSFKLVARGRVFAGFQQRVCQVFVSARLAWLLRQTRAKRVNSGIIILLRQRAVGVVQLRISGLLRGGWEHHDQGY